MSNIANKPETIVAQALHRFNPESGGVIPSLELSTTYARDETYNTLIPSDYQRVGHPLLSQVEAILTRLEQGQACLGFNSGMAAATCFLETLPRGARVVAQTTMYYGVRIWLQRLAAKEHIRLTLIDTAYPQSLARALQEPADLVWVETPCNPGWDVLSIMEASRQARQAGAEVIVDATVLATVACQPLTLGADYVMHSATKYLNGHSDVLAGAIVAKAETQRWLDLAMIRNKRGTLLPPFECSMLIRGMRTLFLRYRQSSLSAMMIARHFENHPKIERVVYPGLPSHPGHNIAAQEMTGGFSGMMSFLIKGGFEQAKSFCTKLNLIIPATSLGGVESLAEHRKTVEGPDSPIPDNLVRLSIGIEDADDLIADISQALGD